MSHAAGQHAAQVVAALEAARCAGASAFDVDAADRAAVDARAGKGASTYGEVLPAGMPSLLQALGVNAESRFADLGSGAGLLAAGAALLHGVPLSLGIELSAQRHSAARASLASLRAMLPETQHARLAAVHLSCGDLLQASWMGCTHAFAAATCFPPALLHAMLARAHAERVQRIALTVPLPEVWRHAFAAVGHLAVPMTFAPRVKVHVLERRA